jgi:LacI family transcriptional regulator
MHNVEDKRYRRVAIASDFPDSHTDLSGPMGTAIAMGRRYGWRMLDLGAWGFRIPGGLHFDGLISRLHGKKADVALRLHKAIPISVALEGGPEFPGVITVRRNEERVGVRAAKYFLSRGFRNFATCSFLRDPLEIRLTAFSDYVRETGEDCACFHVIEHPEETSGIGPQREFFQQQISGATLPLALLCFNDRLAARACRWCLDIGIRVPEQVAILGVGNYVTTCECSPVPLSSIDLQSNMFGAEAAKLLQRMMDGELPPKEPPLVSIGEIVTRRSTDILAVRDVTAARALRHIWDHYREDIGLNDIAKVCEVSRSTLTRAFRQELGHGVNEEINRRRLLKASRLLATTEMQAEDIAARSGFRSAQYFHKRFKNSFGMTPMRYRDQQHKIRQ